jgi:hypothetical protein
MRAAVDYVKRAKECHRLAKLSPRQDDWGHFLEMAKSWEMLLKHQRERVRQQTIALADRFRNVLFLSEVAANEPAEENNNEKASLS